jgi:rare lipoprotein A
MHKIITVALAAAVFAGTPAVASPIADFLKGLSSPGQTQSQEASPQHRRGRARHEVGSRGPTARGGSTVLASYYGGGERLNSHTANGERFRPGGLTAAHRSYAFGTRLLVTHNGRSVVVRVTDRGPAAYTGRSLDLSYGAASHIGMIGVGVARVHVARL